MADARDIYEIRRVLFTWLEGRTASQVVIDTGIDSRRVARWILAAETHGVRHDGGIGQLTPEVVEAITKSVTYRPRDLVVPPTQRPYLAERRRNYTWIWALSPCLTLGLVTAPIMKIIQNGRK